MFKKSEFLTLRSTPPANVFPLKAFQRNSFGQCCAMQRKRENDNKM